jgi:hypothetical protein
MGVVELSPELLPWFAFTLLCIQCAEFDDERLAGLPEGKMSIRGIRQTTWALLAHA